MNNFLIDIANFASIKIKPHFFKKGGKLFAKKGYLRNVKIKDKNLHLFHGSINADIKEFLVRKIKNYDIILYVRRISVCNKEHQATILLYKNT
jgi:hypothetical protein